MYLTGDELALVSSGVATVAVIVGYLGVRSSNHNQRMLMREEHSRDRLTDTYLGLLQGVHLRGAQLEEALTAPLDQQLRTKTKAEFDPTADREVMSGAQILAYASPQVEELWTAFTNETHAFDATLHDLRRILGIPPGKSQDPVFQQQIDSHYQRWASARSDLRDRIRAELRDPGLSTNGEGRWFAHARRRRIYRS